MKWASIFSTASKSAITPPFIGRIGVMFGGVRPSMSRASVPTASMQPRWVLKATMDGSSRTISPRVKMQVLAVPRSTATSEAKPENRLMNWLRVDGLVWHIRFRPSPQHDRRKSRRKCAEASRRGAGSCGARQDRGSGLRFWATDYADHGPRITRISRMPGSAGPLAVTDP